MRKKMKWGEDRIIGKGRREGRREERGRLNGGRRKTREIK